MYSKTSDYDEIDSILIRKDMVRINFENVWIWECFNNGRCVKNVLNNA